MKLNKIMLATAVAFSLSTAVYAADQGHGKITFTGSIIDAPCSITPDTAEQTIPLGQVSNAALKNGGKSAPQEVFIKLTQCDMSSAKKNVSVTFSGTPDSLLKDNLALSGAASGAAIVLEDGKSGKPIKLDVATDGVLLSETGTTELAFKAYLQGNGASVIPGDFRSTVNFTLAYN